jgi:hypothetical protein
MFIQTPKEEKMKDKDKDTQPDKKSDDKIHVSKSVFQTARDIQQQRIDEITEQERIIAEKTAAKEKKKREEYDRRIMEEKKELLRLKQGEIESSEMIHEEVAEEVVLPLRKKISNFFYHNMWWLWIFVAFVLIGGFLIYDLVTKDRPDLIVLVVANNEAVGNSQELAEYFESFTEDYNNNGEVLVSVYYMPYSDNAQLNYSNGTDTKISAEFQSAEAVIVIGGENTSDILECDDIFENLEEIYPDNPNVSGTSFNLADTDFAEKINITEAALGDDLFLSIRKPQKVLYADEEEMQETYDKDFQVFDKVIKDLSGE